MVFDVKGLVHPPSKVIAFPRFIPTSQGTRKGHTTNYGKIYNLSERFEYLQKNSPELIVFDPVFDEFLCEVPAPYITQLDKPEEKLRTLRTSKNLTTLEEKALKFAKILRAEAGIPWSSIGISGSIMAGLTTKKSDIDPLIYGIENCRKANAALQRLLRKVDSGFKPYNKKELQVLFDFRSKDTEMNFDDFFAVESRKTFQGKFIGTDYFVRFVKKWNEVTEKYGDVCYKNCGYVNIKAKIEDNTNSLFTPCTYGITNVKVVDGPKLEPIEEIVSFRGRFCEQAIKEEKIQAQGKIERVINKKNANEYYRLIIGNKATDYFVLIS